MLTYLYLNSNGDIAEIHGGKESKATKERNSIPPYCIGCLAYLVVEYLPEQNWDLLLANLAMEFERDDMNNVRGPNGAKELSIQNNCHFGNTVGTIVARELSIGIQGEYSRGCDAEQIGEVDAIIYSHASTGFGGITTLNCRNPCYDIHESRWKRALGQ